MKIHKLPVTKLLERINDYTGKRPVRPEDDTTKGIRIVEADDSGMFVQLTLIIMMGEPGEQFPYPVYPNHNVFYTITHEDLMLIKLAGITVVESEKPKNPRHRLAGRAECC